MTIDESVAAQDALGRWVEARCVFDRGISKTAAWGSWTAWAEANRIASPVFPVSTRDGSDTVGRCPGSAWD
jgi:hypothetical protein